MDSINGIVVLTGSVVQIQSGHGNLMRSMRSMKHPRVSSPVSIIVVPLSSRPWPPSYHTVLDYIALCWVCSCHQACCCYHSSPSTWSGTFSLSSPSSPSSSLAIIITAVARFCHRFLRRRRHSLTFPTSPSLSLSDNFHPFRMYSTSMLFVESWVYSRLG
jgi:hypothetical protein